MSKQLTTEDGRQSLNAHAAAKGLEILQDRSCVRYPCEILFDAAGLQQGEFAHPVAKGEQPETGFTIFVHPLLLLQLERVPPLVLYQLVLVNYGDFASADDAETFGANALGLSKDDYYRALCEVADEFETPPPN
jgi:hypothetical protein